MSTEPETFPAETSTPAATDEIEPELTVIDETPAARPRLRRFVRPPHLPTRSLLRWAPWVLGICGASVLLVLLITSPSWGSGFTRVGLTLLGIALGAALLVVLFRVIQGHWAGRRVLLLTAALFLPGMLGVALAPTVHRAQAHALENQGNYERAISEYTAGGEQGNDAQDIARCYLEWGEFNLAQHDYASAVQHLTSAIQDYSTTAASKQARGPMGQALLLLGEQLAAQQQYAQAIQQFERLHTQFNDTVADQQALQNEDEPAAYLHWGQALEESQNFQDALTRFQSILQLFPNSRTAPQAYNAAANDLYAWGQALIKQTSYTDAITRYQQILTQYPNAPIAQQAQQDLNAPQNVSGRLLFASGTPDAKVVIRLSSSWTTGPNSYLQGGDVFETTTDSNGAFAFTNIPLGMYLVDWQQGSSFTTLLHQGTYSPVYLADVEPLRATDLGVVQLGS